MDVPGRCRDEGSEVYCWLVIVPGRCRDEDSDVCSRLVIVHKSGMFLALYTGGTCSLVLNLYHRLDHLTLSFGMVGA